MASSTATGCSRWRDFFPNAEIVGIDLHPPVINHPRIRVECGDATRLDASLFAGPWDLIIDDASHRPDEQRDTWETMRCSLSTDGVYIIEDIEPGVSLEQVTPNAKAGWMYEVDVRSEKQRYDDRLFVYGKPELPNVVYHVAGMGPDWCWRKVVSEQFELLSQVGLNEITLSHVGTGLDWVLDEAKHNGITITLSRSDHNTDHYETFAMAAIQELAGKSDKPVLYLHTKGVSSPNHLGKWKWRKVMEREVVRSWRRNSLFLGEYDCVGFNWREWDWNEAVGHFTGTFWLASAGYLRTLPEFWDYHRACGLHRYSCETWIGSNAEVKPRSLVCRNRVVDVDEFNWDGVAEWDFRCELSGGT